MAKMTLLAKLKALATLDLVFSSITPAKDKDGKNIAILRLENPIPEVRGTQEIDYNGQRHAVVATDVMEVKVHEDNMNDDFEAHEDGTVTYKGDKLILDVAKSTKQVWLVAQSFASSGNKMRSDNRNERLAKLLGLDAANPAANAKPTSPAGPAVVDTNAKPAFAGKVGG